MLHSFSKNLKNLKFLYNNNGFNLISKFNYCKKEEKPTENGSGNEPANALYIRHNFHRECEEGLNEQINCELYASYTYFCMANCLSRPDVALLGYAKFFSAASQEEREHAQKLVDFVNMRGGTVQLCDVLKPEPGDYHNPEVSLEDSISLEKNILKNIEELHKKASTHNDLLLMDFLETDFIPEQYEGIKKLAEMLTNLRRAGSGMGVVLLDLELMHNASNMHANKK